MLPFHNMIFFHNYCPIDSTTMSTAYPQHIITVFVYNYTTQYTDFAVYICFLFTMWYFFTITAQFTLQQCLQHILNIYIQYCLQLHYPVYWLCCLYMLPFHNVIFFDNHCPIHSTTMFTAYNIYIRYLFTITPSILTLHILQQCDIFQYCLQLQHIHPVCLQLHYPSRLTLLFTYASFSQYDIFSQLLHNWLYNNVYSIYSTYTYGTVYNHCTLYNSTQYTATYTYSTVYNYSQMYTGFALLHLQLHYPVYASFSQYDIFSQLLLFTIDSTTLPNVYSISSTYTYSTVYNYTTQYTDFAVYICFLFTMWYFFTITAQFTLQQCLQHILNIYIQYCLQLHHPVYCMCFYICFLFTMWYFFTITAQLTLQQCL